MTRTERSQKLRTEAATLLSQILTSPEPSKWADNLGSFAVLCYNTGRVDAIINEQEKAEVRYQKRNRALAEDTMELKRWNPQYEPNGEAA